LGGRQGAAKEIHKLFFKGTVPMYVKAKAAKREKWHTTFKEIYNRPIFNALATMTGLTVL
jgi:hypothetical protein